MKLALKLTLAPVATMAVMMLAAFASAFVAAQHYGRTVAGSEAQTTLIRTLSAHEGEIAIAHAGVYRTVALMASLDDKLIKAARATLAERLRSVRQAFNAQGALEAVRQIDAYLKHADTAIDLASVDPNTGIAALQSADAAFAAVSKEAGRIVEAAREAGAERTAAERSRAGVVIGGLALASLVLTGLALGLTLRMQCRLVRDIDAAREAAERGAAGDLTHPLDSVRRDELGDLLRAVSAMQDSLSRFVGEARVNAESVATASTQIAQGNQDLSHRTEKQALALQQTAATMEKLDTTVRQNADNARQANQLAQGASTVAIKGGEVVSQVVQTMQGISNSSRKIAEIIGTIDGIAFQTNILALNAAVEAARAGEQGRGFAVVAGEVRMLAQRSAEAAKEIKSLIGASVDQVEQGTALVDQAGHTMDEVVASIRRVSDIVAEISAASAEQSSGVGQVGDAIGQMDQVTQQNAALVEESAAAAESLKGQARTLVQAVSVFKLAPRGGRAGALALQ